MTNAEKIWNFLLAEYKNPYGVAGLMGNLYAESALNPKNLQNTYEKKLGYTDEEYTKAVDNGSYANFVKDAAGYGLAQWTYSARKQNLLNYVKEKKASIGDLDAQLGFLAKEMAGYTAVVKVLKEAKTVKEASDIVLTKYERPADQSDSVKTKRASFGQKYYDEYAKKEEVFAQLTPMSYNNYINSTGTHYISNSGSDENGKYIGGAAGDQTGKEWQLKAWYNRPWTHVFRYEKDSRVGQKLCELGCAAALNDNIGYDQGQRTTYWKQLEAAGYDPSRITVKCEEDCSAGVAANVKAAGHILGIKALQDVSSSMTSRSTVSQLSKAGFTVLTDSKYLTSGKYLLPGDILLYENHHVAMNITRGSKSAEIETLDPSVSVTTPPTINYVVVGTATAKTSMSIRAKDTTESTRLGVVSKGTKLDVIEVLSNGWLKVVYPKASCGYAYTSNRNNKYYDYKSVTEGNSLETKIATGTPKSSDSSLAGSYKTTANVNVRNNAGTSYSIMVTLPKGTIVQNFGKYSTSSNVKWLYVEFTYKNKNWKGFIHSKYLGKI